MKNLILTRPKSTSQVMVAILFVCVVGLSASGQESAQSNAADSAPTSPPAPASQHAEDLRPASQPAVVTDSARDDVVRRDEEQDEELAAIRREQQTSRYDVYNDLEFDDEKARLDNFAIELNRNPDARGYIIAYGRRVCRPGEANGRAKRAKKYMTEERQIDAERIVTVNGGYRQTLTVELYIVPIGATPPSPTPTLQRCQPAPRRRRR